MQYLQPNTTLQGGKYRIDRMLGQGGFGITYLAEQTMLERNVAIKEFFIKELCERDESTSHITLGTEGSRDTVNRYREKFLKEARSIAKMNHPHIVGIIDVFEENGTAYYVMEYCERGSLATNVKEMGAMSEPLATRYIIQVAEALDYIHQRKMNHLDVKTANIMLNEEDDAVLIDFGLSKQYNSSGQQTSTTPVGISEGYAPMEQYKLGGVGEFSPETDIYALGATFFNLLTGITPPSAFDVNEHGVPVDELKAKGVSKKAINIISKAMEPLKRVRMKNVRNFIDGLQGTSTTNNQNDEDITIITPEVQCKEDDRKRKEAEALAKDEAEQKAREVEDKDYKEEEKHKCEDKVAKKKWILLIAIAVVILCIVIIYTSVSYGGSSAKHQTISSQTFNVNGVPFDMMKVEGGSFNMGSNLEVDEQPIHSVTLSSYYIGKTEVTQALWKAVMGSTPSKYKGDNLPVESVSWNDCIIFISKLNSLTGKIFRLPTEAEWEFAARGGKNTRYTQFSGSNNQRLVAWYDADSSGNGPHPVAKKHANELGIFDMSGNVWEWCYDWYGEYESKEQTNPKGPSSGSRRVYRGGSWMSHSENCRPSSRNCFSPEASGSLLGLRLCLSE